MLYNLGLGQSIAAVVARIVARYVAQILPPAINHRTKPRWTLTATVPIMSSSTTVEAAKSKAAAETGGTVSTAWPRQFNLLTQESHMADYNYARDQIRRNTSSTSRSMEWSGVARDAWSVLGA